MVTYISVRCLPQVGAVVIQAGCLLSEQPASRIEVNFCTLFARPFQAADTEHVYPDSANPQPFQHDVSARSDSHGGTISVSFCSDTGSAPSIIRAQLTSTADTTSRFWRQP